MPEPNSPCQRCGSPIPAHAPGGECPVCLMGLSMLSSSVPSPMPRIGDFQPDFTEFELLEPIGRGGMGMVYKARQQSLGRVVAVKLLAPERAADPGVEERFLREAQALARLNHPHIVSVFDTGRAAGTAYLVMEYVEGQSLRDRLRAGPLDPAEALRLVPPLCDALQYAHDQGVVHRDIKPENILLGKNGAVKVADFGLAKVRAGEGEGLTGSGERMGTARYMAPEQWANTSSVDHRADIYSLGVLIYEILTGDLPSPRCKPPSAKAGTDPRLDGVVSRSLEEAPADRYQQAAHVKTDVERIAKTSRWRAPLMLGLVALTAVAVSFTVAFWPRPGPAGAGPVHPPKGDGSGEGEWTPPENLGPTVNSEFDDSSPFISADGLTLLFRSQRPGGVGDGDLWECRRKSASEPFGEAVNMGPVINSPEDDDAPCLSADGLVLVFTSRRGGSPSPDLWMSQRNSAEGAWGEPEKLGPDINTDFPEYRPWLTSDGLTLTFYRSQGIQSGLWVSRRQNRNEPFGTPVPYAGKTQPLSIGQVTFTADGNTAFFNRFSWAFPGNLLWYAPITDPDQPFQNLRSFGSGVNSPGIDTNPAPTPDGSAVYFESDRPAGRGGRDIWVTRRVPPGGKK